MTYDVTILGGGFAGLTLALQLKQAIPQLSIQILERRHERAPAAIHKVGESVAELGSYYLREILQLSAYLDRDQLPKFGFRLFFSPEYSHDISRRVEVGSKVKDPLPAHHIDRGRFENDLAEHLIEVGVQVLFNARVKQAELSASGHVIHYEQEGKDFQSRSRWIVDSTGRSNFLKRQLHLDKEAAHDVNAVWFRFEGEIDIDNWSDDATWRNYLDPGRRRLSTNHLMGEGYWIWIIPLVSGYTSVGIVADPAFHPLQELNSFEKVMKWLGKYEPLAGKMLQSLAPKQRDFRLIKHFSQDTSQFYSSERWGLTGDSGAFLDPFYSPGTDFIALGNTWLTELITRDIRGEDIHLRTQIYERAHRELLKGWSLLYRDMYGLFGKTQVMLMKTAWDWSTYWAIPNVMFRSGGYTDIDLLKQFAFSVGRKFARLNAQMQKFFLDWSTYPAAVCADRHINFFDLNFLYRFHFGLAEETGKEELITKLESNLSLLEKIAAEMIRMVCARVHGTPSDMGVDPYQLGLSDTPEDMLLRSALPRALDPDLSLRADLKKIWLEPVGEKEPTYVP